MLPFGGNSVMASRLPTDPDALDYFPTPPPGGRAVAELVRMLDPWAESVEDPACGEGHLAHGLQATFDDVRCADIHEYGLPPELGLEFTQRDFLSPAADDDLANPPDWYVTNAPFIHAEAFIRAGLRRAWRGVAVLLRLQFKEGGGRHGLFTRDCPLALSAPFSERLPMFEARWDPGRSSTTAYCAFFFMRPEVEAASPFGGLIQAARDMDCSLERLIPPGTLARLSRPSDLAIFGPRSVAACLALAERAEAASADAGGVEKLDKRAKELRGDAARISALVAAGRAPGLFDEVGAA